MGLFLLNFYGADFFLRELAKTAEHRQQPPGFGVFLAPDRQAEPNAILEVLALPALRFRRDVVQQLFRRCLAGKMLAHEGDGDLLGAVPGQQLSGEGLLVLAD